VRVLLDLSGAPATSGGMRQYAEELVSSWGESYPDDELILFGARWPRESLAGSPGVRQVVPWRNDAVVPRALGQLLVAGLVFHWFRADALLSVSSLATPLVPRGRTAVVVHDWRHIRRPAEFGRAQRLYRHLWRWSARRAGATVSISTKTRAESEALAPGGRHHTVSNGRDHARRWPRRTRSAAPAGAYSVTTFGHHANKRPELVIAALGRLPAELGSVHLRVLGARGAYADELSSRAAECGLEGRVSFPGFVSSADYQEIIESTDLVVLASSDEGFGLPVAEAQYFGIPAVVMDDSGLPSIHPFAIAARPDEAALAVAMATGLVRGRSGLEAVRPTWTETAGELRAILAGLVDRGCGASPASS
jgi:glycosyltransferase involved in cell wall biosynthesis